MEDTMRMLNYILAACLLTTYNVVNAAAPIGMEKCYGVARAGFNDCTDMATICDKSVIDGDPNYFVYVPVGVCNKIVGGLLLGDSNTSSPSGMTQQAPPSTSMPTTPSTTNGMNYGNGTTTNSGTNSTGTSNSGY